MLSDIIAEKITHTGPISFRDFMEMALYFPGLGYYTSPGNKIGMQGDYYTCPNTHNVFGRQVAKQIEEMWAVAESDEFVIVEYGAGDGRLCCDVLDYFKTSTRLYDKLHYAIVEKNMVPKPLLDRHLEKVEIYSATDNIPPITGCVISNELIDNFPVHRVEVRDELMEVYVGYDHGFTQCLQPASASIKNYMKALDIQLPCGYCTEINLDAQNWIERVAGILNKGFVMTIDYGHSSQTLYNQSRSKGTLLCYHNHEIGDDPYCHIGQQDITTHVNFSALNYWGAKCDLAQFGFTSQRDFLLALGLIDDLNNSVGTTSNMIEAVRKIGRLKHLYLVEMGDKFKVLIQGKRVGNPALKGMQNACML